ncbi:MAG TPA: methyltransferase domain-containing protein [Nevskia sp.]|nr:methyltransferase domain-containing protein [Nevskia sp.]
MTDPQDSAFHRFEKSGWENAAAEYDDAFARITAQSIVPLLDAVGAAPGVRLLDVACGPGYVAAQAAARGASVLGIDFSAAMVALARRRHPDLEFREGDAQALDQPDAAFDAVAMNFGLLHLDQPERALAEAARVLKPGGRCAFTVWVAPPRNEAFRIVLGAIERHGRMDVALPSGPPFFHYSDAAVVRQSLHRAGLADVRVTEVPQLWRFDRAAELFEAMIRGTVRTGALLRAQTPEALERIRAAITEGAAAFAGEDGIAIPMPAVLLSGRKA